MNGVFLSTFVCVYCIYTTTFDTADPSRSSKLLLKSSSSLLPLVATLMPWKTSIFRELLLSVSLIYQSKREGSRGNAGGRDGMGERRQERELCNV